MSSFFRCEHGRYGACGACDIVDAERETATAIRQQTAAIKAAAEAVEARAQAADVARSAAEYEARFAAEHAAEVAEMHRRADAEQEDLAVSAAAAVVAARKRAAQEAEESARSAWVEGRLEDDLTGPYRVFRRHELTMEYDQTVADPQKRYTMASALADQHELSRLALAVQRNPEVRSCAPPELLSALETLGERPPMAPRPAPVVVTPLSDTPELHRRPHAANLAYPLLVALLLATFFGIANYLNDGVGTGIANFLFVLALGLPLLRVLQLSLVAGGQKLRSLWR
ncbi:hypothetical protein [Geodermatophilus normandii]|uniref:Uncharacterized protein n=1 Tax=Geodermatophilus normandii TaxID=1137989 RepID=A0A6P0GLQ6_9ACTN|nr:hypothetical protein [Geodermatophilus normandii]NEM08315.1 hypothetical protein [Geodermatophilus normandii]